MFRSIRISLSRRGIVDGCVQPPRQQRLEYRNRVLADQQPPLQLLEDGAVYYRKHKHELRFEVILQQPVRVLIQNWSMIHTGPV
jgi:hypothetical protein